MEKKLLIFILLFCVAGAAYADSAEVEFSLDGINPAPETIDVFAGQTFTMYAISDSDGLGYWRLLTSQKSNPVTISNVQSYPAAG